MEFSTLNGYKVKDKKAIRFYNTVEDMINDSTLKETMHAKTKGYYSVNDGGSAEYHITATQSDSDYQEELDNGLYATLISNKVNIKMLGATGDDTTDDTEALSNGLNNFKELIIPSGTYKITSNILVDNIVTLKGEENAVLHFTNGTENLAPDEDSKINMSNIKIISDSGIVYHINRTGVVDTRIENNNIESSSYAILVNANSDNGKNLYITNNTIDTDSDGIEINTTSDEATKFKNTVISNNIISVSGGSGSQSGFGIGVANGKNVNISNNIIDNSRLEAIHIEDTSKEIVINGNVLTDCKQDGVRIYGITGEVERCIVNGNNIKGNKATGYSGINLPTVSSGVIREISLSNNNINNFDIGIQAYRNINANGTIIENCNKAFNENIKTVKGDITLIDTPVIANFTDSELTHIDSVRMFNTDLTGADSGVNINNMITSTNANKIIEINHLSYRVVIPITATTDSRVIKFMKLPTYLNATIKTNITTGAAMSGKGVAYTTYDSTNGLSNTKLTHVNSGVFSEPNNVIKTDDDYLAIQPYNPNQSSGFMYLDIEIDGTVIIKGVY